MPHKGYVFVTGGNFIEMGLWSSCVKCCKGTSDCSIWLNQSIIISYFHVCRSVNGMILWYLLLVWRYVLQDVVWSCDNLHINLLLATTTTHLWNRTVLNLFPSKQIVSIYTFKFCSRGWAFPNCLISIYSHLRLMQSKGKINILES